MVPQSPSVVPDNCLGDLGVMDIWANLDELYGSEPNFGIRNADDDSLSEFMPPLDDLRQECNWDPSYSMSGTPRIGSPVEDEPQQHTFVNPVDVFGSNYTDVKVNPLHWQTPLDARDGTLFSGIQHGLSKVITGDNYYAQIFTSPILMNDPMLSSASPAPVMNFNPFEVKQEPGIDSIFEQQPQVAPPSPRETKITHVVKRQPKVASITKRQPKVASIAKRQPKVPSITKRQPKVPSITKRQPKVPSITKQQSKVASIAKLQPRFPSITNQQLKVASITKRQLKVPSIVQRQSKVASFIKQEPEVAFSLKQEPEECQFQDAPPNLPYHPLLDHNYIRYSDIMRIRFGKKWEKAFEEAGTESNDFEGFPGPVKVKSEPVAGCSSGAFSCSRATSPRNPQARGRRSPSISRKQAKPKTQDKEKKKRPEKSEEKMRAHNTTEKNRRAELASHSKGLKDLIPFSYFGYSDSGASKKTSASKKAIYMAAKECVWRRMVWLAKLKRSYGHRLRIKRDPFRAKQKLRIEPLPKFVLTSGRGRKKAQEAKLQQALLKQAPIYSRHLLEELLSAFV